MNEYPISLNGRKDDKGGLLSTIALILVAVIFILLLIFNTLYTRIYVVGQSMQTTLTGANSMMQSGGDYVYICKYIEPKRGNIVVIDVGNRSLIKRVIAFGGESVKLEDGVLYINGKVVEEPYINPELNKDMRKNNFAEIVVDDGCVFCMGDNRDNSEDSRGSYGCIPLEDIEGVVADWSLQCKQAVTGWNTFFEFTLPELFDKKNNE